jgi:hypothetical protein
LFKYLLIKFSVLLKIANVIGENTLPKLVKNPVLSDTVILDDRFEEIKFPECIVAGGFPSNAISVYSFGE